MHANECLVFLKYCNEEEISIDHDIFSCLLHNDFETAWDIAAKHSHLKQIDKKNNKQNIVIDEEKEGPKPPKRLTRFLETPKITTKDFLGLLDSLEKKYPEKIEVDYRRSGSRVNLNCNQETLNR